MSELRKQILEKQKELDALLTKLEEDRNLAIRNISEFDDAEKIQRFDKIYQSAISMMIQKENDNHIDEDAAHYTWEEVMEILARDSKNFWKYYNSL